MAHKTFISYKFSEATELRDNIITALGKEYGKYYQGETSDSPDLTDTSTEYIKKVLKDMIFNTTVTIVIISPKMKESKWIDWEIEYSLKKIKRDEKTSSINGIIGVIKKEKNSYDWFIEEGTDIHGQSTIKYKMEKLYNIISKNHFNSNPPKWHCSKCKTYDYLNGSYITFVKEEEFLKNPQKYIENAYNKSQDDGLGYELTRKRDI